MIHTTIGTPSPWTVFDVNNDHEEIDLSLLGEESLCVNSDSKNVEEILDTYEKLVRSKSSVHIGYPYNLDYNHSNLHRFLNYSINNLGDPFVSSNYGVHSREFERSVVGFFAELWGIRKPDYWGYVTTCGTEGNMYGILLAREKFPDGILYASRESHYSVFKSAKYYRMQSEAILTDSTGSIDCNHLMTCLEKNKDYPAIININIGTTVKGAIDDLYGVIQILKDGGYERDRFYIHCDGALFALMLPFIENAPHMTFDLPIDSITVSGHKMLGCPMPCGVVVTRKENVDMVENHIEYLNSVDTTIMGSRNGQAPLFLWYSLKKKGLQGIKEDVQLCLDNANYLYTSLKKECIMTQLNDLSTTVVMERPKCEKLIHKWQLACQGDIAHVVVMPNVSREKLDIFVREFKDTMKNKF
jgi:histidine decarboxylase